MHNWGKKIGKNVFHIMAHGHELLHNIEEKKMDSKSMVFFLFTRDCQRMTCSNCDKVSYTLWEKNEFFRIDQILSLRYSYFK